ncbi:MAG TPA: hypothetical protein VGH51_10795 [Candidatus Angelobacter sp.]
MKNPVLVLLFGTVLLTAQTPKSAAPEAVKQGPRIFVAELHFPSNPDWDGLVRSKLISSLVQDCGSDCTVVEAVGPTQDDDGDGADGVLTGDILVQSHDQRHYRVQGAMRLVDKNGKILWAATIYSSPFARSATSSFAENTAKKLSSFLKKANSETRERSGL